MTVPHASASAADPARLLAAAEARFASGDHSGARAAIEALAPALDGSLRARACNDLAVLAVEDGDLAAARDWATRGVAADPGSARALETLALCCEAAGDLAQAAHWLARAAQADGDPGLWRLLARVQTRRGRLDDATHALARARALQRDEPSDRDLLEAIARRGALRGTAADGSEPPRAPGRVLICVEFFHPSVGGSEILAETAGVTLQAHGWQVEIATNALPDRRQRVHRGMRIHEIGSAPLRELEALVARERFDALLSFAAPTSWPVLSALQLDEPRPWRVLVPCVNEHNHALLSDTPDVLGPYRQLAGADDVVMGYSSHAGWDARLLAELGLRGSYVPNAVDRRKPSGAFRAAHGIREDVPLVVAIGNLWREKNHPALISELRASSRPFRLAIIGRAVPWGEHAPVAEEIAELTAADERFVHIPGADADGIAAALREASLLVLPSLAEATPLVLLEAMSHGVPWIATPTCGSADDHAGGVILPLHQFRAGVEALLENEPLRQALGGAGEAHWAAAYTWDAVGPRYARLLAGATGLAPLEAPAWALDVTEQARAAILDGPVLEAA